MPVAGAGAAGDSARQRRYRILVVDDDPDSLELITSLLTDADYEVHSVQDAIAGKNALDDGEFQLVVTDLYLGDDALGYEVADAAAALRSPVPVVLVTGRPSFENARDALRSRISEFVVKPFHGSDLVAACQRSIDQAEIRRRNRQLETQNRVLANVLPRAIEAKDPITKGHAERVVQYADTLARRFRVDAEDREALKMASLLHDVGKIGIPNRILCKDGPLTVDEREVIQRHPRMGFDILEPLENSDKVRRWVYQHHERWDAKGYPEGLSGEEVELPGRILILAEVFDALASPRSYKPAWPTEKCSAFFRQQAGKHFDPDLAHIVADGLDREGTRFFAREPGALF